jgi:hypothetical protein
MSIYFCQATAIFDNNTCFLSSKSISDITDVNSTVALFRTMGKPSLKSRKSSRLRKNQRKVHLTKTLKNKEVEIADLQVQMQEFKKTVFDSGMNILNEVEKTSQENNNLVEWLKIYDRQIKENEKEIYDLSVRLYFSQQQQQYQNYPQHQPQSHQQHQPQPQQPQYKSLAEYFATATSSTATSSTATASTATSSTATASTATSSTATSSTATSSTATASTATSSTATASTATSITSLAN